TYDGNYYITVTHTKRLPLWATGRVTNYFRNLSNAHIPVQSVLARLTTTLSSILRSKQLWPVLSGLLVVVVLAGLWYNLNKRLSESTNPQPATPELSQHLPPPAVPSPPTALEKRPESKQATKPNKINPATHKVVRRM